MIGNSVSWLIALIISTKSCVTSFDFKQNLMSVLPNLSSPLITKPTQGLQQAPKTAVNILQRANPLYYLVPSYRRQNSQAKVNTLYSQNNAMDSFYTHKYSGETRIPNIQYTPFTTAIPFDEQKKSNELPSQSTPIDHFMQVTEQFDRKFYEISFNKLSSISAPERQENGITFAESGLFLYLELLALCVASDVETALEIEQSLGLKTSCKEQLEFLKDIIDILPKSSNFLKFRWSSRLVLGSNVCVDEETFGLSSATLHIVHLNETYNTEELTEHLNHMIEIDSGWAMQDTFEEEELSNGVCAAWMTTMYLRAQWRSAPTVLNGTRPFYDGNNPSRPVRMIRINDVMQYVRLEDWDAEAIEIQYATPKLSLMILLPRGRSLRKLSERVTAENIHNIYKKMQTQRIAVILPIYTLRMILLLPGKLEMMGISRLVDSEAGASCKTLKLSHSVQRIMFWAEAGRNAFKDDGIEWDERPDFEIVVDRPYIFFVRWKNITLLNGNFVL